MPTLRQKKAFKEMVENSRTQGEAMVKAGYSKNTAIAPTKLTKSKGWQELTKKYLDDAELAKKHNEQLNSSKLTKLYFDIDDDDETIEAVCHKLGVELLYIKVNKDETGKTANVKAPDYFYRDLALDKAYKVKGHYKTDGEGGNKTLVLVVTGESAQRYGIKATPEPEDSRP